MRAARVSLVLLAGVSLAVGVAVRPAAAQSPAPTPPQPTGIRVSGQGVVTAPPDIAVLNVGASVRRETPGEAFDRAEQLVNALFATLRANGVSERDIQTRELSLFLEPTSPRTPEEPPPPPAWRARYAVSVKLREFGRIGPVVSQAVAALAEGAELHGIVFTIEDRDPLIARAREAAAADARAKAETLARGLGARLGQLLSAQEVFSPTPAPVRVPTPAPLPTGAPFPQAQPPIQVSPGELTITVTVEALFAIVPAPVQ